MFGQARSGDVMTERVQQHAGSAFGELVAHIEYAMTSGALAPGDATDVAQQIWGSIHGAVALELNGLVKSPDPGATYERLLHLLLNGARP